MSFKIGDVIVQRVILGYGESLDGTPLYTLQNLQSFQVQFNSQNTEYNDGAGNRIKVAYRNRSADVTATNALINFPIIAQMSGSDAEYGTTEKAIKDMPRIFSTKEKEVDIKDATDAGASDMHVSAIATDGTLGDVYTLDAAGTGEGTFNLTDGKLKIVPKDGDTKWIVSYKRDSDNGMKISITGSKFPKVHRFTARCLIYNVCDPSTPKSAYLVLPRFQSSPDLDLNIQQDGSTLDFTGSANVDYCSEDKDMLLIYTDPDDNDGETI